MYMLSRLVVSDFLQPQGAVVCQAPPSMGFLKQGYWNALLFPTPGDLPGPGTEPESPALVGGFFTTVPPGKHITDWYSRIQM